MGMRMTDGKLTEIMRKSIHISSLVIPFAYKYVFHYNQRQMFILLLGALIISLTIELYRLNIRSFHRFFHRFFGMLLRRHEINDFTGATFLIFSSLLCVTFFKPEIAFLSIAFLSVGDTFAAIVGMSLGKRKFMGMKKSLEGSIGCFTSILIFAFFFNQGLNPWVFTAGALAATIAELWNLPLDDNLKLPLTSGMIMTLINVMV